MKSFSTTIALALLATCDARNALSDEQAIALRGMSGSSEKVGEVASVISGSPAPPAAAASSDGPAMADITMRTGNGDNLPYPGSDFLGVGYNAILGNPEGDPLTQMDPGFRLPVIQLTWSQDASHLTRDVRDLEPVGGFALPQVSCYQNDDVSTTTDMEDYMEELEESVEFSAHASGGYGGISGGASFEGSSGTQTFEQTVATTTSTRYTTTSFCVEFKVGFDQYAGWENQELFPGVKNIVKILGPVASLEEDTHEQCAALSHVDILHKCEDKNLDLVKKCPKACGLAEWYSFFDQYGTHFLTTVYLGGKRITEVIIDETTKETIESTGEDSAMAAKVYMEANVMGASASAGAGFGMSESSKNAAETMASSGSTKTSTKVFGGIPPEDSGAEGFSEWAHTVREFPMPVRYSLASNFVVLELTETFKTKGITEKDYELAVKKYGEYAVAHAKHVAKLEKEAAAKKLAAEDAEAEAKEAELDGTRTVIATSSGWFGQLEARTSAYCIEMNDDKSRFTGDPDTQGKVWTSPNGEVKLVLAHSGALAVTWKGDILWHNKVNLVEPNDKWGAVNNAKDVYNYSQYWTDIYYGCGHDDGTGASAKTSMWEVDVGVSRDGKLETQIVSNDHEYDVEYKHTNWQSCGTGKSRFGKLVLQDDGNLVMLNMEGEQMWASGSTHNRKPAASNARLLGAGDCK